MSKHSSFLDRDAEYIKTLKVSRLPGYLTVQMVRFQFKQKEAMNAKILKDIKFPMMLDCYDYCKPELQEKLVPMRSKFKDYEDAIVATAPKGKGTVEGALKKAQEEMASLTVTGESGGAVCLGAPKPAVQELPASLTWSQVAAACKVGRKLMVVDGEVKAVMAYGAAAVLFAASAPAAPARP